MGQREGVEVKEILEVRRQAFAAGLLLHSRLYGTLIRNGRRWELYGHELAKKLVEVRRQAKGERRDHLLGLLRSSE